MVICLERGADLHMAQLMPLPLTVSCFSKIQVGFTFMVPAHLGSPRKGAVKWVCVSVSYVPVEYISSKCSMYGFVCCVRQYGLCCEDIFTRRVFWNVQRYLALLYASFICCLTRVMLKAPINITDLWNSQKSKIFGICDEFPSSL